MPEKNLSRKVGADRLGEINFETGQLAFGELVFTVFNADDITDACVFAMSRIGAPEDVGQGGIPVSQGGSPCLGISQASIDDAGNVDVYMLYRSPSATGGGGDGTDVISFTTSGGSARILYGFSYATYGSPPSGYDGAIGSTPQGDINGCDIDVSTFDFAIERTFTPSQLNDSFVALIRDLTNHVNLQPMFFANAGEIRFLGADGVKSTQNNRIAFKFRFSPNVGAFSIGAVTVSGKDGHEYLDVYYSGVPATAGAAIIHQVYLLADLRALGFN
jgi:hypothetical protein